MLFNNKFLYLKLFILLVYTYIFIYYCILLVYYLTSQLFNMLFKFSLFFIMCSVRLVNYLYILVYLFNLIILL